MSSLPEAENKQTTEVSAPFGELEQGKLLLERYRITERIAKGGLSIVYRAQDERLGRPVCIKLFHISWWDESTYRASYDLFIQEAFALSQLTHPNTLRILDFGYVGDEASGGKEIPFQVSEYMNAGTLSQIVRRQGPFSSVAAAHIAKQLCGPLAEAHSIGIIHRDIKPQNILFGRAGPSEMIKLADFGIATILRGAVSSPSLLPQGDAQPMLMFSRNWAAPEQLIGQEVSSSTDIYSLGLLIVYMLTGQIVFHANDPEQALDFRLRSDEILCERLSQQQLSADKIDFLLAVCSYQPERRPTDIASFKNVFLNLFAPQEARGGLSRQPTERMPEPAREESMGTAREPLLITPEVDVPEVGLEPQGRQQEPAAPPARPATPETAVVQEESAGAGELSLVRPELRAGPEQLQYISAPGGSVKLLLGEQARVRLTFVQRGEGRHLLHLQGLNCFLARANMVPTPALQLSGSETVIFLSAGRKILARARVGLRTAKDSPFALEVREAGASFSASSGQPTATIDQGDDCKVLVITSAVAASSEQQLPRSAQLEERHGRDPARS